MPSICRQLNAALISHPITVAIYIDNNKINIENYVVALLSEVFRNFNNPNNFKYFKK